MIVKVFDAKAGRLARPRPCDGQRIDKQSKLMILPVSGGDEGVDRGVAHDHVARLLSVRQSG